MKPTLRIAVTLLTLLVLGSTALTAADTPAPAKEIAAADARKHVGERVTVQFKVQHTKSATNPDRVYIDSEKDYRDPKNLGVLIEADSLPAFKKAGIEKPAEHYDAKSIRISGNLFLRDDNIFITAERTDQIEIIKEKSKH